MSHPKIAINELCISNKGERLMLYPTTNLVISLTNGYPKHIEMDLGSNTDNNLPYVFDNQSPISLLKSRYRSGLTACNLNTKDSAISYL